MSNLWCDEFSWPFKTPATHMSLKAAGKDPQQLALLGLNECPLTPSHVVAEAGANVHAQLHRYPDNHYQPLSFAVADDTGVEPQRQIWAAGASDLIYRCVALATRDGGPEGGHIVSPSPTFWGYERIFALTAAHVTRVPLFATGAIDVDAMIAAIRPDTSIVTFTTPANPSGLSLTEAETDRLIAALPPTVLFLVDEVYHEFARYDGEFDLLDKLSSLCAAPWVLLRSFSKAWRLAGARVGYGLASNAALAERLQQHGLNFAVSSSSFELALASYKDRDGLAQYLDFNAGNRQRLHAGLELLGLSVLPSSANFVSVELPVAAASVTTHLIGSGIYCGQWPHSDFKRHIRVGVGSQADIERFLKALQGCLAMLV